MLAAARVAQRLRAGARLAAALPACAVPLEGLQQRAR